MWAKDVAGSSFRVRPINWKDRKGTTYQMTGINHGILINKCYQIKFNISMLVCLFERNHIKLNNVDRTLYS